MSRPPRFEISPVQESDVKTLMLANFGQFDHDRLAKIGQKYQKAHLQVESFPLVPKSNV